MTTSESVKAGAPGSRSIPDESALAAAAGLPDPAVLARLANEFLRAIPGADQVSAVGLPDVTSAAPARLPASAQHPAAGLSEADLAAIPATLSGVANPVPTLAAVPTSAPRASAVPTAPSVIPTGFGSFDSPFGIPGGASVSDFSTMPSFGFLQDARTLFASPPAVPVHAVAVPPPATVKIPTETDVRTLPANIPGAKLPPVPATRPAELGAPQVPGAAAHPTDYAPEPAFGFLGELNPLMSFDVAPTLAPVGQDFAVPSAAALSSIPFDVGAIRRDFPILQERVNGRQLIWLDNAATTQKPQSVIDRLSHFYEHENSNIHRAAHTLAARATDAYEAAREKVRRFLNAADVKEIIFVRGATEGVNLVAQSWGRRNIGKGDEIVVTWLEHHANIVPWQMLCAEKGAKLRVAPVDDSGQVLLDEYEKLLGPRTRLVSIAHVSNALGTVTPVAEMAEAAHRHGAKVLVDGAQAVSHMAVDVQALDCDFYVFSGHKVFAPTGIGVVYGKSDVLDTTPPWQGGGNMIADVTFEKTLYQPPPLRFEAGTGSIGDAVGLGAAIDYVERIGMANIARYEHDLLVYAIDALRRIPGLRLIGTAKEKASVLSFVLDGFRTEDVGAALNKEGIAVRSGHHCAQPILRRFGVESTVRPSLAFYNTCEEIDALVAAVWNIKSGRSPGLT